MSPGQPGFAQAVESQDFSFGDLIDTLNPLQHIPVVSTIYREITGDQIAAAPRMMGSVIYGGGVTGAIAGLADAVAYQDSGKGLSEHAVAIAFGEEASSDTDDAGLQVAQGEAAGAAAGENSEASPSPAATAAEDSASAASAASSPSAAAGADAAAGPATGNAALQALMRDLNAGGALQNDHSPTAAGPQAAEAPAPAAAGSQRQDPGAGESGGPGDGRRQQQASVPSDFMPIGGQDRVAATRARTTAAALRAEGDAMGSKRLQAEPKAERVTVPEPSTRDTGQDGAGAAAANEPAAKPASGSGPRAGSGAPTQGDFAERMMRALERYEKMRAGGDAQ